MMFALLIIFALLLVLLVIKLLRRSMLLEREIRRLEVNLAQPPAVLEQASVARGASVEEPETAEEPEIPPPMPPPTGQPDQPQPHQDTPARPASSLCTAEAQARHTTSTNDAVLWTATGSLTSATLDAEHAWLKSYRMS